MLRAALRYAELGWPVFPCAARAKAPLTLDGFHAATTDAEQVRAWWTRWPRANIGHAPGRAGHLVIDIDGAEGQASAVRLGLRAEPTLIVTSTRGEHRYYRHPGGTIGNRRLAPGIDVRADAGYVLVPPSIHPSGRRYVAVGSIADIIPLPPAALDLLRPAPPAPRAYTAPPVQAGTPRRRAYVHAAIEAECYEVATAPEGTRNDRLNMAAFSLARFVETREADSAKLADVLAYAAQTAGLGEREIERTITSAFGARGLAV
jgi:hypothetical protein